MYTRYLYQQIKDNYVCFLFQNFETLIAMKLKWDLAAVTGFDFIDQILQRVNWCNNRHEKIIRVHSVTLLHFTCTGRLKC